MHSIAWWPTLSVLVIATITDIRGRRIPNWLVVPFLIAGIGVSIAVHGWRGTGQSAMGIALAGLLIGPLCWLGGMGMGDLKLCAAIGAWVGPAQLISAMVMMALAGGFIAFFWALRKRCLGRSFSGAGDLILGAWRRGVPPQTKLRLEDPAAQTIPYAPAIAIGTILSFFGMS